MYASQEAFSSSVFKFYEKGIYIFEYITSEKHITIFLSNLFVLAQKSLDKQSILQALKLLKRKLLAQPVSYALAKLYGTLGSIYLKLIHKNRVAVACLRKQIALLTQLNREEAKFEALIDLGFIYESLKRYGDALSVNTEAIAIAEKLEQ